MMPARPISGNNDVTTGRVSRNKCGLFLVATAIQPKAVVGVEWFLTAATDSKRKFLSITPD